MIIRARSFLMAILIFSFALSCAYKGKRQVASSSYQGGETSETFTVKFWEEKTDTDGNPRFSCSDVRNRAHWEASHDCIEKGYGDYEAQGDFDCNRGYTETAFRKPPPPSANLARKAYDTVKTLYKRSKFNQTRHSFSYKCVGKGKVDDRIASLGLPKSVPLIDSYNHQYAHSTWYEYAITKGPRGSLVWYKGKEVKNKANKEVSKATDWKVLRPPHKNVMFPTEISADSGHFIILDQNKRIFTTRQACQLDPDYNVKLNKLAIKCPKNINDAEWTDYWGHPLWFNPHGEVVPQNQGWSISFLSLLEDRYLTESHTGTRHSPGQGVTSIFLIGGNGSKITFLDPWLPRDHSYEVCLPKDKEDNIFRATNIDASGSTLFVTDQKGNMYTKTYDFDISGADNIFFNYTFDPDEGFGSWFGWYDNQPGLLEGWVSRRVIPTCSWEDSNQCGWTKHPRITDGRFNDKVNIIKTGVGALARELRVEGEKDGNYGYWYRGLEDTQVSGWKFKETKGSFSTYRESINGRPDYAASDAKHYWAPIFMDKDIVARRGRSFKRGWKKAKKKWEKGQLSISDIKKSKYRKYITGIMEVENWHHVCTPASLKLSFFNWGDLDLRFHFHPTIRPKRRGVGIDDTKLLYGGAIELPEKFWRPNLNAEGKHVRQTKTRKNFPTNGGIKRAFWEFTNKNFFNNKFTLVDGHSTNGELVIKARPKLARIIFDRQAGDVPKFKWVLRPVK